MPSSASLSFDGVNDVLSVAHHSDLHVTGDLTLECWIKPTNYSDNRVLIFKGDANNGNQTYALTQDFGFLSFYHGSSFSVQKVQQQRTSPTADVWVHYAVRRSGTSVRFYVDGVQLGTDQTIGGTIYTGSAEVRVGAWTGSNYFLGKMDEVRIWNVARTDSEILDYYAKKANGSETGLVGCWHIEEGTGLTTADAAGTAQDLSITGASWDTGDFPTLTDAGGASTKAGLRLQRPTYIWKRF
jgi:hypothetical protein